MFVKYKSLRCNNFTLLPSVSRFLFPFRDFIVDSMVNAYPLAVPLRVRWKQTRSWGGEIVKQGEHDSKTEWYKLLLYILRLCMCGVAENFNAFWKARFSTAAYSPLSSVKPFTITTLFFGHTQISNNFMLLEVNKGCRSVGSWNGLSIMFNFNFNATI